MRTPILAALALLTLASSAAAPARADAPPAAPWAFAAFPVPRTTSVRLENGLAVVLEEDHRAPVVSMVLRYSAGSRDDPPGREGLAALTERMMLRSSGHVPEGMYYQWLERAGGWGITDMVGADATTFGVTVPSNALPLVAWLWSDQMGFFVPSAAAAGLTGAKEGAKSQRRTAIEGAPYGRVRELVRQSLYAEGHPYREVQSAASIDAATVDDVTTFFEHHFAPNDAVLTIVGDIVPDDVIAVVRKHFGPIQSTVETPRRAAEVSVDGEIRLEIAANVPQAAVLMTWPTPTIQAPDDAELDVVSKILGGQQAAWLHWELVDKRKVATRVSAAQVSKALSSEFEIWAQVAPGHSPEEVRIAIDDVLRRLRWSPPAEANVRSAVTEFVRPKVFNLDQAFTRAALYAEYEALHDTADYFSKHMGHYERVTSASARTAAIRWLPLDRRVVTFVRPDPSAAVSGVLRAKTGGRDSSRGAR